MTEATTTEEPRYLSIREAAAALGMSWSAMQYHVTRGRYQHLGRHAGRWEVDAAILSYRRRGRARSAHELRATSPCARAVLAALPGTSFDIAERTAYSIYAVRAALWALKRAGRVVRDPGHIWRQA